MAGIPVDDLPPPPPQSGEFYTGSKHLARWRIIDGRLEVWAEIRQNGMLWRREILCVVPAEAIRALLGVHR